MVGLIWTIHTIHYALFPKVGEAYFPAYESEHINRIGKLLLLPWTLEGVTLLGILWLAFFGGYRKLRIPSLVGGFAMAVVLVISGFWSAPAHGVLVDGFDKAVYDRLMTADLVRTLAWTVCGFTAVWILVLLWPMLSGRSESSSSS